MISKAKPLPLGAIATTHRPGQNFRPSAKQQPWNWEFYILPNPDANERIALYLTQYGIVEEHTRCMALPGYAEKQFVYALRKDVMDKVSASASLRNTYKAFVRYQGNGSVHRYRTPEQIEAAKNRRAKKLEKRARLSTNLAPNQKGESQ